MPSVSVGRSSSSRFSVSRTPSAIAVIWRGLPPVQITKKSVNPPAFRRSRTTTSSAFLSSAARTAPATALGNCPLALGLAPWAFFLIPDPWALIPALFGLRPWPLGLLSVGTFRFATQVVYRQIVVV